MSNKNDVTGCVIPIVLLCTAIAAIMVFMWIGKGITSFIKESPGGFFVIVLLIAVFGWAWLSDKLK